MNYTKNQKYLGGNDTHYYVGLTLVVLGVLLFMMGEMMWIWIIPYQFFVAVLLAIIGGLLICIPSAGAANEEEIDAEVKARIDELSARALEALPKNMKKQAESPTVVGQFILDRDNVIIRKGRKDGKYRSSLYSAAVIMFQKESIIIRQSTFSLITDEASEMAYDIPYTNMPSAIVETHDIFLQAKKTKLQIKELQITDNEETKIIIPVINSVLIDEICEKLNSEVKRSKV